MGLISQEKFTLYFETKSFTGTWDCSSIRLGYPASELWGLTVSASLVLRLHVHAAMNVLFVWVRD